MTVPRNEADSDANGSEISNSDADLRRMLELQLVKIRSEASAARLEAKAAEIEWTLRKLRSSPSENTLPAATGPKSSVSHQPHTPHRITASPKAVSAKTKFANWNDVRAAQTANVIVTATALSSPPTRPPQPIAKVERSDGAHVAPKRPRFLDLDAEDKELSAIKETSPDPKPLAFVPDDQASRVRESVPVTITYTGEDEDDDSPSRRPRPAAWLVSTVMHLAALILLAGVGMSVHTPKDQVALSASTTSTGEESIETFQIENSELTPETEVTEPTPSETEYEISPVGELMATDFSPDAPAAPPTAMASALASSASAAAASSMSMNAMPTKTMEFCGVEGGGNHFVYLVDSSGSMGDGFDSARQALLQSVDLLTPDQRFYVVFFDADSDYMRLTDPNVDEPRSVFATPENKAALKRWAMRISKDTGRAPYDALRFALTLKPDVIFLLSDGEFPQGIEDLLIEENVITNLFGDSKPVSIVHTIAYFSEEGESRMRRIAKQNQGQYRYVPKPGR